MTTIHDPEGLLRSFGDRPTDQTALAAARADIDRRIAALSSGERENPVPVVPHRRTRGVVMLSAAAAVVIAAVAVIASIDSADENLGDVVAAGPNGFVVPATESEPPFWCTERADIIDYAAAVDGGVGYLMAEAPDPEMVIARTVQGCQGPAAAVAGSLVRVEDGGNLTGAATLWGPNAVDPLPYLPNLGTTSEMRLGDGTSATVRMYDAAAGDVAGLDGVAVVSWRSPDGDWVLTTSGLDFDHTLDLATAASAGGAGAMHAAAPDFLDMTPDRLGGPSGLSWIVMHGNTGVVDPACVNDCFPSDVSEMPDHLELRIEPAGTLNALPWAVEASTRTLRNPYANTTAVYRVVDIDGVPALFLTAGESGLQGQVEWEIAPGVLAWLRGTWGGSIEGVLAFAESAEAITADDPRLPEPFDPDATP